jgi:hypothetical protein
MFYNQNLDQVLPKFFFKFGKFIKININSHRQMIFKLLNEKQ